MKSENQFPLIIPCDKRPSKTYEKLEREINDLNRNSKQQLGYGYSIEWETVRTKFLGTQDLPVKIFIETENDYLKLIKKEREVKNFREDSSLIIQRFPNLTEWVTSNPLKVIKYHGKWTDLSQVFDYFTENPIPNMYIRELPIRVHTKFIEQHQPIIGEILDILISGYVHKGKTSFHERYNLKKKEPLIRFRVLDSDIRQQYFSGMEDISTTAKAFHELNIPVKNVFVMENEINFLVFPYIAHSIVIWGEGYKNMVLNKTKFMESCRIIYWGDIDTDGFRILSKFREIYPQTESIFMDRDTFETYYENDYEKSGRQPLNEMYLTESEWDIFEEINEESQRLEQEKIPHSVLLKTLKEKNLIQN